jgi:2-C-methyl-D-erythritol 2,4-cyclodiphosphate synthase
MRIGFGYDVHKLVEGRELILGGVHIPHTKGLGGHSDADVLIHAAIDSILGALSQGDIGSHFPDNDIQYRDIDSRILLRRTDRMMRDHGFEIGNLDVTVCAEKPRLSEFIKSMRQNLAYDLQCPISKISIKATTEENLGVSGNERGIAAYAVVLLKTIL